MTIEIDISSDIDEALRDTDDFFRSQVPFAMAGAITDTAFDVRRRVVGSTWNNAFEVRNKSVAARVFKITDGFGKKKSAKQARASIRRELKTGGVATLAVTDDLGYDWIRNQIEGGTKTARGTNIAVPVKPDTLRSPTGRIRKPNKPRVITNKKNHFLLKKGGRNVAIMKRSGKDTTAVYLFIKSAPIPKRFRFYEDAEDTTLRVFPGHFDNRFAQAIRTSRFVPA